MKAEWPNKLRKCVVSLHLSVRSPLPPSPHQTQSSVSFSVCLSQTTAAPSFEWPPAARTACWKYGWCRSVTEQVGAHPGSRGSDVVTRQQRAVWACESSTEPLWHSCLTNRARTQPEFCSAHVVAQCRRHGNLAYSLTVVPLSLRRMWEDQQDSIGQRWFLTLCLRAVDTLRASRFCSRNTAACGFQCSHWTGQPAASQGCRLSFLFFIRQIGTKLDTFS